MTQCYFQLASEVKVIRWCFCTRLLTIFVITPSVLMVALFIMHTNVTCLAFGASYKWSPEKWQFMALPIWLQTFTLEMATWGWLTYEPASSGHSGNCNFGTLALLNFTALKLWLDKYTKKCDVMVCWHHLRYTISSLEQGQNFNHWRSAEADLEVTFSCAWVS